MTAVTYFDNLSTSRMIITRQIITVSGLEVEVLRKAIKNLYLRVQPPTGRVRLSVPLRMSDERIRLAVTEKLAWIRRHQNRFLTQPRHSTGRMVTGESCYYGGKRYQLNVIEKRAPARIELGQSGVLTFYVRPGTTDAQRENVFDRWLRAELKAKMSALIKKWEAIIGVKAKEWRIKKMKTRWGSCNTREQRIWLNLELAKKPTHCLEYVLVHELVHLLERRHNDRFKKLMDRFLPGWRQHRDELNDVPSFDMSGKL